MIKITPTYLIFKMYQEREREIDDTMWLYVYGCIVCGTYIFLRCIDIGNANRGVLFSFRSKGGAQSIAIQALCY